MDEDRFKDAERDISDLRVSIARLESSVDHLSTEVGSFRAVIGELRDTLNRGRGALWTIGSGAGLIGALASYTAAKMFGN